MRTLVVSLLLLAFAAPGHAQRNLAVEKLPMTEKRIALVIGNAAYKDSPLRNPVNDAKDMAAALRKLGFDVIEKTDATQKDMNRAIAQFGEKLRADTVALFFYAGHGMQVKGKNYIIPVDAHITGEATVRVETVDVDSVMDQLAISPMNIVILDACRNNPFERRFRSTSGGLAQMDAPKGSLIAYATAPGKTAADGDGRNGLYTQELLKHIQTPGLTLETVFKRVRNGVMAASGEAQTPWESSSLTGDFYFQSGPGAQVAQLGPGMGVVSRSAEQIEDELWDAIKNSDKEKVFEEYIRQYPKGRYLPQARVKLAGLKSDAKPAAPAIKTEPSPPAANNDADTALWRAVEQGNSADDYDVYLKQYPKGKYVALAKQRSQKLKEEAAQRAEAAEQSAWRAAEGAQTAESYTSYLAKYPKGKYAALAQTRANKLNREATERAQEAAQRQAEQARQAAARGAEEQRKAREEAARGPQWADADNGYDIDWNEATQYCANKGSGWRLPTVAELQASYQSGHSTPCGAHTCKVSSNSRLTRPLFWTNERSSSSVAWFVVLKDGARYNIPVFDSRDNRALCIRQP